MKNSPLAALTAILAALFVLVTAAPAQAHDTLKSSDPAKDATVKSVDEVTLEFSNKVRMPFVIVRGPGDVQHQAGDPEADGPVVRQKLKGELPDGKYTIAYRVVSSDGHPIDGEIPFTVKGASPSPAAGPEASAASPEASAPATAEAGPPASAAPAATEQAAAGESSGSFPVWLLIVVGALVGIGIGFLLSARKKKP